MKLRLKMKIHQEGIKILVSLLFVLLLLNGGLYCLSNNYYVLGALAVPSIVFYFLVVNFFRMPNRHFQGETNKSVVAAADGVIVAIEEVMEYDYFNEKRLLVSIFMNIFDVHANWFSVNGEVVCVRHHRGRFMAAYLPKSSTENERSMVVVRTPEGHEVMMRQIAGAMARRIVTYAEVGDSVTVDDQMGFIKFGSRVDIYLPLDTKVLVSLDDKTVGNQTLIAKLS